MNFKEWYYKNLIVGMFPYIVRRDFCASDYHYIINVSDEFYSIVEANMLNSKCYWFPMNERRRDIGLNSIYASMVILQEAEKRCARVYLHCHSGRNRSRIIECCYYYMRTGEHLQQGNEKYVNRLHRASVRGYLPPMAEMEQFLKKIKEKTINMEGGILDECKIGIINNF